MKMLVKLVKKQSKKKYRIFLGIIILGLFIIMFISFCMIGYPHTSRIIISGCCDYTEANIKLYTTRFYWFGFGHFAKKKVSVSYECPFNSINCDKSGYKKNVYKLKIDNIPHIILDSSEIKNCKPVNRK